MTDEELELVKTLASTLKVSRELRELHGWSLADVEQEACLAAMVGMETFHLCREVSVTAYLVTKVRCGLVDAARRERRQGRPLAVDWRTSEHAQLMTDASLVARAMDSELQSIPGEAYVAELFDHVRMFIVAAEKAGKHVEDMVKLQRRTSASVRQAKWRKRHPDKWKAEVEAQRERRKMGR